MKRRGFVIPLVVAILAIAAVLGISMLFVSSQHMKNVIHIANKEQAYHLASSAAEIAGQHLEETIDFLNDPDPATFPKRMKAPEHLKFITEQILDSNDMPLKTGADIAFPTSMLAEMNEVLEEAEQVDSSSSLKVSIGMSALKPFFIESGDGIKPDIYEGSFFFMLNAKAVVGNSPSTVVRFRESRFVNLLPGVLGKFTLFLRSKTGIGELNDWPESLPVPAQRSKLNLNHGRTSSLRSLSLTSASAFFDEQGWVYLGGMGWNFSASHGRDDANLMDSGLSSETALFEVEPDGVLSQEYLKYYSSIYGFHPELTEPEFREALKLVGDESLDLSSRINLLGTEFEPSPTILFGLALRKFALVQGLTNTLTGATSPLPYLDEGTYYEAAAWPGDMEFAVIERLREQFGNRPVGYSRYESRMSSVVQETYNALNLRFVDLGEEGNKVLLPTPGSIPTDTMNSLGSNRLKMGGLSAKVGETLAGSTFSIQDDQGRELYSGDLSHSELPEFMRRRSGGINYSAESLFELHFDSSQDTLEIPGIIEIEGNLNIDRPLRISTKGGGVIMVKGDVTISAGIENTGTAPFSLICAAQTGGSINVQTIAPVEACLVALGGEVKLVGGAQVRGCVIAGGLSIGDSPLASSSKIQWDPVYDPTESQNYKKHYRYISQPNWRTYVQ